MFKWLPKTKNTLSSAEVARQKKAHQVKRKINIFHQRIIDIEKTQDTQLDLTKTTTAVQILSELAITCSLIKYPPNLSLEEIQQTIARNTLGCSDFKMKVKKIEHASFQRLINAADMQRTVRSIAMQLDAEMNDRILQALNAAKHNGSISENDFEKTLKEYQITPHPDLLKVTASPFLKANAIYSAIEYIKNNEPDNKFKMLLIIDYCAQQITGHEYNKETIIRIITQEVNSIISYWQDEDTETTTVEEYLNGDLPHNYRKRTENLNAAIKFILSHNSNAENLMQKISNSARGVEPRQIDPLIKSLILTELKSKIDIGDINPSEHTNTFTIKAQLCFTIALVLFGIKISKHDNLEYIYNADYNVIFHMLYINGYPLNNYKEKTKPITSLGEDRLRDQKISLLNQNQKSKNIDIWEHMFFESNGNLYKLIKRVATLFNPRSNSNNTDTVFLRSKPQQ